MIGLIGMAGLGARLMAALPAGVSVDVLYEEDDLGANKQTCSAPEEPTVSRQRRRQLARLAAKGRLG